MDKVEIPKSDFTKFVALEEGAEVFSEFAAAFVPGLLQTEEYARALLEQSWAETDRGQLRLYAGLGERRLAKVLNGMARLDVIIDEAVFSHTVRDARVMQNQIDYLIDVAGDDRASIRVLRSDSDHCATGRGSYAFLEFDSDDGLDPVGLTNGWSGSSFLSGKIVETMKAVHEQLHSEALDQRASLDLVHAKFGFHGGPKRVPDLQSLVKN